MPFPPSTPQKWRIAKWWSHKNVFFILSLMYLRNIEVTNMKLVWHLKIFCETFYNILIDGDVITHFGLTVVYM